jgi:hypothetical protein
MRVDELIKELQRPIPELKAVVVDENGDKREIEAVNIGDKAELAVGERIGSYVVPTTFGLECPDCGAVFYAHDLNHPFNDLQDGLAYKYIRHGAIPVLRPYVILGQCDCGFVYNASEAIDLEEANERSERRKRRDDVLECWAAVDPNTGAIRLYAGRPRMWGAHWTGRYLFDYTPTSDNDLLAGLRFEDGPKCIKMILREE